MPERDPLVSVFCHLADFPRASDALHTLKRVASLVKPVMRARGFKVQELAEFYPSQSNLLGVNYDRGRKICLRLRYPGDKRQFMPFENVVDTMLHELCHNVHGPHNQHFHALWDQLRDELQGLLMKGYTGEGFLGAGQRLGGGQRMPNHEIRRLARQSAEKRRRQYAGTALGHRLGGSAPPPGQDIRNVIVGAVERRNTTLKGCGTEKLSEKDIRDLAETATRNGFRTQAEEDEANETAIAQALWELVQEDEKAKYGDSYIPPSAENPIGNGGGSVMANGKVSSTATPGGPAASNNPYSDLVGNQPLNNIPGAWNCEVCTLSNPPNFLCCDACGSEKAMRPPPRPAAMGNPPQPPPPNSRPAVVDLTADSPPRRSQIREIKAASLPAGPQMWICSFCGTNMDRQWWTCSTCGKMKDSSR